MDGVFEAAQNARLIASAEEYYRVMYYGGPEAWNLRDRHMAETLSRILEARGPGSKAVVWAHNSHIGDARHTEMGVVRGEVNLGQLVRERYGDEAALVGFGTHAGTVAAASRWDGPMRVMAVRPSLEGSYERLCHDASERAGVPSFVLDLGEEASAELAGLLAPGRPERFIGVIYRPETEVLSHYAEASLPDQFDAYVWFDETRAVTALAEEPSREGMPETWPFGV
jgi:erythromycin esterase-like protein